MADSSDGNGGHSLQLLPRWPANDPGAALATSVVRHRSLGFQEDFVSATRKARSIEGIFWSMGSLNTVEKQRMESETTYRLLVIEDDPEDIELLQEYLAESIALDFVVESAQTLAAGLDELRKYTPDCILLDLHLPDSRGLDTFLRLRAQLATVPTIVLTGLDDTEVALAALRAGAQDYLPKADLNGALLERAIPYACERARLSLELHLRDQAVEAASTGVVIADARLPDQPLTYVNRSFTEITGYEPEDVLGKNCRFLQGPDTDPAATQAIQEALDAGREVVVTLKNYRKHGGMFWNELIISPVRDASGVVTHFVGIQNDVTARVEAEEQLKRAKESLEARVQERTRELQEALALVTQSHEEALLIVGLTLEYRDYETKGHTERVTALAQRLGRALGLDDDQLVELRWGSYLHDTGKITIADDILLKPGKLTTEEFGRMKEHVVIGEEMLQQLTFLTSNVLNVVRHHHERWDGAGYPDGLSHDSIPVLARIFSVVDVYDALTSVRPYKSAWSHDDALEEIVAQRGRQFAPEVVDAFVELFT